MLQRTKRKIHYCRRYIEDDMELFYESETRRLNLLPISGELTLLSGGEVNSMYLKARIKKCVQSYSEGDRAYVNIEPPEEHDMLCDKADYVLKTVLTGHNVTELIFEKRL